jgi:cytoskeletal protein RodZ
VNYSNRPIYQRRRRIALLIFVGLLILTGLFWVGLRSGGTDGEQTEQEVFDGGSSVEQAPGTTIDEQTVAEEETVEEDVRE